MQDHASLLPVPELQRPELPRSTRIGIGVLAFLGVYCLVVRWLPPPAGQILSVLIILVALPLAVMVLNDFSQLRQDRLVFRHLELVQATEANPVARLMLDAAGLSVFSLARWRRWRKWLALFALLNISLFVAVGARNPAYTPILIMGPPLLRDLFLGINALEQMPPEIWLELPWWERAWLRLHASSLAIVVAIEVLAALGFVAYVWFSGNYKFSLSHIFLAVVWGGISLGGAMFAMQLARMAYHKVPEGYVPGPVEVWSESDDEREG